MPSRLSTVVDLNEAVLHRSVFELRYEFGQLYFDRTGRICRQIVVDREGWDFGEIGVKGAQLTKHDENLVFSFNDRKLDLQQGQTREVSKLLSPGEFGKLAESLCDSVISPLELVSFPRIGYRVWYLFETKDREQSYDLMRSLAVLSLGDEFQRLGSSVKQVSFTAVLDRGSHMVRVVLAPFEQSVDIPESVARIAKSKAKNQPKDQRKAIIDKYKASKFIKSHPPFGLLMDLDFSIEEPPFPNGLSVSNFIESAIEDMHCLQKMVLKRGNT